MNLCVCYSLLFTCSHHREGYQVTSSIKLLHHFVSLLITILCCCCWLGIDDLKFSSADELIGQGHAMSTKFKTASTYGFQPVTMSTTSLELFLIYFDILRPSVSQGRCNDPQDPLWINWKGGRENNIGRKVQRFYIHTLGLDVTTTRIRSLVETVAHDLYASGEITLGEKQSTAKVNGHSSSIVEGYYLRENMDKCVHQSRQVFEVFCCICIEDLIRCNYIYCLYS